MSERGTAVVTGAGQGIGKAIAARLIADGYDVLAVDINAELVAAVAHELGCRSTVADVGDPAQIAAVAALAPQCTALINNAAIQRYEDLLHTTAQEMRQIFDVNVIGPILLAQALVPIMVANGGGSIVNFSSITSQAHPEGTSVYPASKAAINQITEGMAQEFGRLGIRVNSIGPGTVMTEGTAGHYGDDAAQSAIAGCLPIARMGQPEDIANAVSFFCSDEASWVTGQTLYVDGGHLAAHGAFFRWARKVPKS